MADTQINIRKPISFADHKVTTAEDCDVVAKSLMELAAKIREGNLDAFEDFWISGGTEEGDAKIQQIRELIVLRYLHRQEFLEKT